MRSSLIACGGIAATLLGSVVAKAGIIETYVIDVGGQSGYPNYVVPAPVLGFFGPVGVGLPSNGLPVGGLSGTERLQTTGSGTLTDSASATGSGGSDFGSWSANGSSSANASFGKIGAEGAGTQNGIGDGNTVVGFEGVGLFQHRFTFHSPTVADGSPGFVVFRVTVEGDISVTGISGAAGVDVEYQQNAGSIFTLMAANIQSGAGTFFTPSSGPGFDGYTISPTSISGSGVFDTISLNQEFGTAFDLKLGLLAWAMPRGGSAGANFNSTAVVTGIDVYDAQGFRINDFSVVSDTGTVYDANGAHFAAPQTVPEPGMFVLLITAALSFLIIQRCHAAELLAMARRSRLRASRSS